MHLFSHNPRRWPLTEIKEEESESFKSDAAAFKISQIAVHMPYLPNLASLDEDLYRRSIDLLCENIKRAQMLGAVYLVLHPGNTLLLENTTGQGTEIGHKFSQLKKIISSVNQRNRIGICLDTAHAFASGCDITTEYGLNQSLENFDRHIGIKKLHFLHLNDSPPLGSRSDRHWHIGKGHIGIKGFRLILNHPLLKNLPGVMETPDKTEEEEEEDRKNMKTMRYPAASGRAISLGIL